MLYTFSQAHYSETELQRYLTEITENDAVVLWQDGVLLAVKYGEIANNALLVYFVSILIWMCRFLNLCRPLCQSRSKMKPLPSILQVQWKNWWHKR